MHREIKIKQFPIVTTHWWPKDTKRAVCVRKRTVFISFFTSCTQPCPSDLSAAHIRCVTCVVCAHSGSSASTLDGGRVWSVVLTRRHSYNTNHILLWCCMTGLGICMRRSDWLMPPLALEKLRQHHASDTPSVKREPERAHTHVTPDVCALRSLDMVV